jgi:hypothetical protein
LAFLIPTGACSCIAEIENRNTVLPENCACLKPSSTTTAETTNLEYYNSNSFSILMSVLYDFENEEDR